MEVDEAVADEFAALFGLAEAEVFVVKPEATIYANEVFERFKAVGSWGHYRRRN